MILVTEIKRILKRQSNSKNLPSLRYKDRRIALIVRRCYPMQLGPENMYIICVKSKLEIITPKAKIFKIWKNCLNLSEKIG